MPTTLDQAIEQIRQFKRTAKLLVYRTSIPASGDDYFVRKVGAPDGSTSNGVEITDFRLKCSVERSLKTKHDKCDVEIYNLARDTRSAMETKPLAVELSAGHAGVNRLVLAGDVLYAISKHDSPNWITLLQVGDGARALSSARSNISYPAGATIKQVLRDIARNMGQTLPRNIEELAEFDAQFAAGGVVHGSSRDALLKILAPYGVDVSIQHGQLQILRQSDSRAEVHEVSEKTGMIGSPEFGQPRRNGKPPTMSVKMLLRPEILAGSLIDLASEAKSGRFKVTKVKHDADTHDPTWFTEVEIQPFTSGGPKV